MAKCDNSGYLNTRTTNDHRGVKLPIFTEIETGKDQMENIGLAGGGGKIQNCRDKFRALLRDLIRLASLQVCHHNRGVRTLPQAS